MIWSTTVKDLTTSTVFRELPKTLRHFKITYAIMFSLIAVIVCMQMSFIPQEWQITGFGTTFTP